VDKKRKRKLNNKLAAEKKKRHVAKRTGCLELWRVGEGHSLLEL
jgi:hypothetical protein